MQLGGKSRVKDTLEAMLAIFEERWSQFMRMAYFLVEVGMRACESEGSRLFVLQEAFDIHQRGGVKGAISSQNFILPLSVDLCFDYTADCHFFSRSVLDLLRCAIAF